MRVFFPFHLSNWNHFVHFPILPLPISEHIEGSYSEFLPTISNFSSQQNSYQQDINSHSPTVFEFSLEHHSPQQHVRPQRRRNKLKYLQDYVCSSQLTKYLVASPFTITSISFPLKSPNFSSDHSCISLIGKHHDSVPQDPNHTSKKRLYEPLNYEEVASPTEW